MTLNKLALTGTIMGMFMASCSSFNPEKVAQQWDAVKIGSELVAPSPISPYIGFTDGNIYGFTGCNQINGGIKIDGNKFTAKNMAMTMKLCPDAKYEEIFVKAMNKANAIKPTSNGFELVDETGDALVSFMPHCLDTKDLDGQWNLVYFQGKPLEQNDQTPFLIFDIKGKRMAGFTGCNRLTGTIDINTLKECKVDFTGMGMTRKMCDNHVFEADFVDTLNKTKTIRIFQDKLYLYSDNEDDLLIFEKSK